ncbi:O-antigen ligase family protein [bacterium]|nr:O-antigen ligase family protein [bacterium]
MILKNNKKILFYIFLIYAIFSTVSISVSETFYYLGILFFIVFFRNYLDKKIIKLFFFFVLYFLAARIITSLFSGNILFSLGKLKEPLLFLGFIPVYFAFSIKEKGKFIDFLIYSMAIITLYAIILHLIKHEPFDLKHRLSSTTGGYMTYGSLVCVILILNFYKIIKKVKVQYVLAFLISLSGLLLSFTRSAYLGFLVAIFIFLLLYKPKYTLLFIVLLILIFFFLPNRFKMRITSITNKNNSTNETRLEMWRWGFHQFKLHPITGIGARMVKKVKMVNSYGLSKQAKKDMVHLHSVPVHLLTTMGLFGILGYLLFLLMFLYFPLKNYFLYKNIHDIAIFSGIFSLIIIGLFEYNLFDSEITMLISFTLGLSNRMKKPISNI